jgi:uncharacterized membrane protein
MANGFSGPVEKIVDNYLGKLKKNLAGFPEKDREELVREIHSHIYESYRLDPTENEVEKILKVLDKLGEPAEVISARVSPAMVTMGKKKKLPFYILAGTLIALFGVPLGLGGLSVAIGLIMSVVALIAAYYITAFSLVLTGWLSALILVLRIFFPAFLDPYVEFYPLLPDPTANTVVYIVGSLLIAAIGLGMFWLGKYMMRGIRFFFRTIVDKIRGARSRKGGQAAAGNSGT